jgi:hypothetical protein
VDAHRASCSHGSREFLHWGNLRWRRRHSICRVTTLPPIWIPWLRASSTARRKQTHHDCLRWGGRNMRLHPNPAAQRIATGLSAETQTWPKFAPRMRLSDDALPRRLTARFSHDSAWQRVHRFGGHRFGGLCFCVRPVAFAINDAGLSSARAPGLAGVGWPHAPPSMVCCPAHTRPLKVTGVIPAIGHH